MDNSVLAIIAGFIFVGIFATMGSKQEKPIKLKKIKTEKKDPEIKIEISEPKEELVPEENKKDG